MRTRTSDSLEDSCWDNFLESRNDGHYQQSSAWAQYKAGEGWSCRRVVFEEENEIVGGYQLLWKKTRRGKLAYVSKGPVIPSQSAKSIRATIDSIKNFISDNRILAAIVQGPDDSHPELIQAMDQAKLAECSSLGIVDSTILMDVTRNRDEILASMRSSARSTRNKALRSGLIFREGDSRDLSVFFDLMKHTCERQKTNPQPHSLNSLTAVWNALNARSPKASLQFVEHNGKVLCGAFLIRFGNRITIYKFGWDGAHREFQPNPLLFSEILLHAAKGKAKVVDFATFDRDLAISILNGVPVSPELLKRRDFYKSAYGGIPQLLPTARIWIRNPAIRFFFNQSIKVPAISAIIRKTIA